MMTKFIFRLSILSILLLFPGFSAQAKGPHFKTQNVILVTLDGMRWREVFQGVDKDFFGHKKFFSYKETYNQFKKTFWRKDVDSRRKALMPFLWNVVAKQGQIYGNRNLGSRVNVTNKFHFSYPGYNEILSGHADPRVNSNDKVENPNWTFLEWLNHHKAFKGKTAAFGSWDVFPYIVNQKRSGLYVNAGFEPMTIFPKDRTVKLLNQLQKDLPSPWDDVRMDAFTYNYAFEYLKKKQPRALFISLGETDDFAHDAKYDQYIYSARRDDAFIGRLWKWIQSNPHYRNKTTLMIATDHGRGHETLKQWESHGHFKYTDKNGVVRMLDLKGDGDIWIGVIGPDTPALGEMKNTADIKQSQIAATLVKFLGLKYKSADKSFTVGKPIETMFRK